MDIDEKSDMSDRDPASRTARSALAIMLEALVVVYAVCILVYFYHSQGYLLLLDGLLRRAP